MALNTGSSLFWKTGIDNTGLKTGSIQAKGILRGLARNITGMDIFAGLGIGAGIAFAKITKSIYNFSKEFETAMKEVQTISKAVQDDFKGISKEIIAMSKTVPDNAQKLTKALYQIVSAGYDGAKAMEILRISTELAVASVTDTFTAADTLTYVMNAYGESAGAAAVISDKLFTIVRLGKVKMEELGPTISMVTGLAAEAGLAFDDLAAMYAEAVKKIQPHIVSTGIRGILTAMLRVSKGTGEAADKARELGIEFDITALKSKGFKQILHDIIEKTKGNKAALMELFPNVRGLIGLLAVMTGEGKAYNETLHEIENSLGATERAFKTMVDTTENQLAILRNNVMAKFKPLGDSILKSINEIASGINIAMSGANDELSKLARSYSELTDTLRRKQGRVDNLISTIEDLRSKTELTREETTQLEAAERALGVYFPIFGKAAEDAASSIDILTLAKEGTIDLSIRIMELELEQAKIEKRRADLALSTYNREEDEDKKEIDRMQKRLDSFHDELTIRQIIERQTTGQIKEYIELENDLSNLTEKRALKQEQLNLNMRTTKSVVDALTESLENLKETREKPIIITPKFDEDKKDPDKIIPVITDTEIEEVKDKLKYMASQYKKYLSDVAEFNVEHVRENNALLAEEGENYAKFLSDMLVSYKDNADLSRQITDDIYEYNNGILARRKEAEKELFDFLAGERERDLKSEKDKFEDIIKDYKEGSNEYIAAVKKHEENVSKIKTDYAGKEAEARLTIFKEGLEKQIGEEEKAYTERLRIASEEIGKKTKLNKEYFEFVNNKLHEIAEIEKALAEDNRKTLDSYLAAYKTAEEKIVAIKEKTAKLLTYTDNKYEKDKLKSIERILIAEIKANEAKQEMYDKLAGYGGKLDNKELEDYIIFLEDMKLKYTGFANVIILLNKKIAESQKQIWENVRAEIDETIDAIHALANVVGNFDSELEEMINSIGDLVSGVSQITIGFATGNITGIISGIAVAISSIINLFVQHKSDVPELRIQLQAITLELQKQQSILSQSIGTKRVEEIKDTISLLQEQISTYNAMIQAEKEAYGQFLWWTWSETDQEAIEEWLSAIESANAEIAYLWRQYKEILTGTTAESIADAIAEGFSRGLTSAEVFADTFNDMMKKAIIDAFKRAIITKYIEDWYDQFAILSKGGLTTSEINALTGTYEDMIEAAGAQWKAMKALFAPLGIDTAGVGTGDVATRITRLTGAIAGITEETAGLLAGQFQAIRINTVNILSNMESIIIINSKIAENTEYNKYLEHISNKLDEGIALESEYLRSIGGS